MGHPVYPFRAVLRELRREEPPIGCHVGGDHRVLAIEVKLAHTIRDDDVRHLRWLKDQLGDDVSGGIGVVPAALLGP